MDGLHQRLLRNYSRFLETDLDEDEERQAQLERRKQEQEQQEEQEEENLNPFHNEGIPVLSWWRRTVTALLDADEKPLRDRLDIFHTMSKAYTAALSTCTTLTSSARGSGSLINYALHTFTQEAASAVRKNRSIPRSTLKRLKTIARLWFHALLQGFETCQLIGFHEKEPWAIWEKMQALVPVPELWSTLVLQYVVYEAQHNYIYGCFYIDDMHYRLTAIAASKKNEEGDAGAKGEPGSIAKSDFVKQTYNFRRSHDENGCVAHAGNLLFQRRFWHG